MTKGRKKISNEDKIARGTNQPVRMNSILPDGEFIFKAPPPPKFFDSIAKKIYKQTCQFYIDNRMLNLNLITSIVAYAQEYSKYFQLQKDIMDEGFVVTIEGKFGSYEVPNPKEKMAQNSMALVIKLGIEMGLTPASQSKIISNLKPQKDPDDGFFS